MIVSQKADKKKTLIAIAILVTIVTVGIILFIALPGASSDSIFKDAKKGDIITFGSYEQDGNTANGAEPIEWEVLDADGDSVLVVSCYVLDCVPYNEGLSDVTWENCTLRTWLNRDFYDRAFSPEEQGLILESTVLNMDNEYYGKSGGNNTKDKLFCLSVDEIYRYYEFNAVHDEDGFRASEALITGATPAASSTKLYTHEITIHDFQNILAAENYSENCIGKTGCIWWTRSPAGGDVGACRVYDIGDVGWDDDGGNAEPDVTGVRPAMRLQR
ncbi:MAG: hypothetical protein IJR00_12250 [Lachnospiraceae bacterium]|nr:hypothetical protein [Lachnospiraceae bacterium]